MRTDDADLHDLQAKRERAKSFHAEESGSNVVSDGQRRTRKAERSELKELNVRRTISNAAFLVSATIVLFAIAAFADYKLSNGLTVDGSGFIKVANGGIRAIVNSYGFPLDSKGNLLVNCSTGCSGGGIVGNGYITLNSGTTAAATHPATNATMLWAFVAPFSITTTTLHYQVNTADNSASVYNLAIFDTSGNIVCQTGAVAGTTLFPSTGPKTKTWTSSCALVAGTRYYFAMTGNATVAILSGAPTPSPNCGSTPTSNSTTSSAVWTTPIGIPSDSWLNCNTPVGGIF